jgi:hypothetical protein
VPGRQVDARPRDLQVDILHGDDGLAERQVADHEAERCGDQQKPG